MQENTNTESITLGGGCFWCTECVFAELRGVLKVESGYSNGMAPPISYEAVCSGTTGCVEVTRITFEPSLISLTQLLEVFFAIHDPTTLNRQGADVGTQYRSGVYYEDEGQAQVARELIAKIEREQKISIVTEVLPLERYQAAEDYHQDYLANNPRQPYCQFVAAPKLAKARQTFKHLLK